ncbi:MAG TPA: glycoside hydrolase [Lentisphaeria bacterium]|nr:MAG: glycoside hydrolase [Lentisphaerae bacterium GWF2_49_21]HBC88880.1 glycoside hydrolase [Lentisphaeria bacterium]
MKSSDIQIRDPFILPVPEEGCYYLFGTTDKNAWGGPGTGFDCYRGKDLENWEGPITAFRPPKDFWATTQFWAPEVHRYEGKYYMFASFKADGVCRGTQILVSEKPEGPYMPLTSGPVTPRDWECLDGTLFVDDGDDSWIVFCHEWLQVGDGTICAMRISKDLKRAADEPLLLFHGSEAPWGRANHEKKYVTDGPFIYHTASSGLLMLWSSDGKDGYAMGIAKSANGKITGPWTHEPEPIYGKDGGHGMIFRTFEGQLMMTLHRPNKTPEERPIIMRINDQDGVLSVFQTCS